jgi:hypothetical protein
MPDEMIAVCGLDCSGCPAHLAWKNNDQAVREKTAREWSVAYNFDCRPDMVNCSGCRVATGPKIGHCADCKMRSCAARKGHATCGDCNELASCTEIQAFFKHAPQARENLEKRA